jgi:hypothetical protein
MRVNYCVLSSGHPHAGNLAGFSHEHDPIVSAALCAKKGETSNLMDFIGLIPFSGWCAFVARVGNTGDAGWYV